MKRVLPLTLLLACGPPGPTAPSAGTLPTEPVPRQHVGMMVYDAAGDERSCEPPSADCPPIAPDPAFEEACVLGGFRIQQCGCDALCTGRVTKAHYDEQGNPQPCEPAADDCAPPTASAAFQDACTERGHHLQACGCERWLCSGDPTK